ncbi:2-dehydro-3-deoxygluconokinase [Megasphaera cerevisiae DSM 20462]|uniref:2-dehydro-3-deoxygluconokinase n=1 Tax=Megasphaera cerevisiae DSM 20462 TaxID=1122219 RepID=A0A0J6WT28_9FIRM|nr:sugar kinase [Megasphaera cerevisiae]KMO85654.1 2-dehydro-3-deoxygluconokinase [Megasphaera cerevisiae DSM 20462]OKY52536.1 2-dehydro-3-deoxygluconokinase [Megasphaera cerevisiae]SKA14241.1 2-keto-3-deoxygluconate kinase [Megasphaera cerevisiae DSM 20462]
MKSGLILAGEPMGLLIAQSEGTLDSVSGYDLAVAGAEFNVAVGVARLGHRVTYMTKLGKDPFGQRIIHVLDDNKIGNEFVAWSDEKKTGFMLKSRVSQGDPSIFYFRAGSAASTLSVEDVEKINFADYTHIHLTGILPALSEATRAAVNLMFDKARQAGLLISFDPNLRPQLWPSRDMMIRSINEMAAKADIVLPGTAEGKILMGSEDPRIINAFYIKNGAKACITKCGGDGAFVSEEQGEYMVPGFKADKIVDTVGAGDGFAAGVITGLMERLPLKEAVRRGNAIGAIQVMSRGDNEGLPYPDQLKHFMQ